MHRWSVISFWFGFLLFSSLAFAVGDDQLPDGIKSDSFPPNVGNFALPTSQQPGPLLSFGQTLIGRNDLQLAINAFSPYSIGGAFDSTNVTMTYGITDRLALYFKYPISAPSLLDINLQLEQAIYTSSRSRYSDLATIVGAVTLPIKEATTTKQIPQGYGAPTYFLGTTFNRTYVDWMGFVSPGVQVTTSSNHVRLGSQVLYQAGIGRNIIAVSDQSILFGLLELDGQYTEKDHIFGRAEQNTGGNTVALAPSIWFSSKSLIVHAGVGFPVVQDLNGNQCKIDYFVVGEVIWTIS